MPASSILELQEIISELDCPICMEIFSPPIYLCTAGHSICSACRFKLLNCPNCKNNFSNGRNYTLEKVVNVIAVEKQCKYFEQGCREILKRDLLESHIKICNYRELKCLCCDQSGIQYNELLKHLEDKDKHLPVWNQAQAVTSNCFAIDYTLSRDLVEVYYSWAVIWFKYKNSIIFVQRQLRCGILYFSTWKYPHNTVGLICNMKVFFGQNTNIYWKMKINAYRSTFTENMQKGAVFKIARGTVLSKTKLNRLDKMHHFKVTYEIIEE